MKRTALQRRTPLRAKVSRYAPKIRGHRARSRYAQRERAWFYMGWVKTQQCVVQTLLLYPSTPCRGVIEADHMGRRGIDQKAPDNTCASICHGHHMERHDFAGTFKHFDQAQMREFTANAIDLTRRRATACGVAIPDC